MFYYIREVLSTTTLIITIAVVAIVAVAAFFAGTLYRKKIAEAEIGGAEQQAKNIVNDAIKSAENKKREIENGVSLIVSGLKDFGIDVTEGMISEEDELGNYGPYTQSKRKEIYHTFANN